MKTSNKAKLVLLCVFLCVSLQGPAAAQKPSASAALAAEIKKAQRQLQRLTASKVNAIRRGRK